MSLEERTDDIVARCPVTPQAAAIIAGAIERVSVHDTCRDSLHATACDFLNHGYDEMTVLMAVRRFASCFYPIPAADQSRYIAEGETR